MNAERILIAAEFVADAKWFIDRPAPTPRTSVFLGLPGAQVSGDPQDRSQRCARLGASGSNRLLQARARKVIGRPRPPLADRRAVGQRVTLENLIRGLAVVFGIRLPRVLTAAFIDKALTASEGLQSLCSHAGVDCCAVAACCRRVHLPGLIPAGEWPFAAVSRHG
jgi:hypothetical protein